VATDVPAAATTARSKVMLSATNLATKFYPVDIDVWHSVRRSVLLAMKPVKTCAVTASVKAAVENPAFLARSCAHWDVCIQCVLGHASQYAIGGLVTCPALRLWPVVILVLAFVGSSVLPCVLCVYPLVGPTRHLDWLF